MVCSSHYINFKTLTRLLLLDIPAQKNAASPEQTKALWATLAALDKRTG